MPRGPASRSGRRRKRSPPPESATPLLTPAQGASARSAEPAGGEACVRRAERTSAERGEIDGVRRQSDLGPAAALFDGRGLSGGIDVLAIATAGLWTGRQTAIALLLLKA